jgi:hypothetical protein
MKTLKFEGLIHKRVYGLLVEFKEPERLIKAAQAARLAGVRQMDAFSPFPLEQLPDAIGFERENTALLCLLGGLGGGILAFGMQWYCNVIDYPINVAGRPFNSWPTFIPVTFELTVLGAALSAAFGMLALNKLPMLWHPVFNAPEFARASRDRFFLCVLAKDRFYEPEKLQEIFKEFSPLSFREVSYEE